MFSFSFSIRSIRQSWTHGSTSQTPKLCSASTMMIKSFSSLAMHNAIQHHIIYTLFDLIFNVFLFRRFVYKLQKKIFHFTCDLTILLRVKLVASLLIYPLRDRTLRAQRSLHIFSINSTV